MQSNEEFDPRTESTDSREMTVESRSRYQRVLIFLSQIFLSKLVWEKCAARLTGPQACPSSANWLTNAVEPLERSH